LQYTYANSDNSQNGNAKAKGAIMFESLSQRLSKVIKTIKGETRLTESNTAEMLREIRIALLEADVALAVVKDLMASIKKKAMGAEVMDSLSPGQALVGIVEQEIVRILSCGAVEQDDVSSEDKDNNDEKPKQQSKSSSNIHALNLSTQPPAIILMAGLQGSGKTTTTGKLAKHLKESVGKKVMTVSCDIYRPAAIEQLKYVSEQAGATWFESNPSQKPLDIAKNALEFAKKNYIDVLLVDTAGRLGIDEEMMSELHGLHNYLNPIESLLVVDAMQGQDAVNTAKAFSQRISITGIVLSKVDGDSRGGAALSAQYITQRPIKFMGISEKIDGIQEFDAKRIAQRILGMGDILAIIEQAQKSINVEEAQKIANKIKKGEGFDLEDFLTQIQTMQKMGGVSMFMDKLPTELLNKTSPDQLNGAEKQLKRTQGIIHSMTPKERRNPDIIKATRKRRIAIGAGTTVQEVNKLLNQFEQMQSMMKKLKGGGMMKMLKAMGGMKALKNKFGM
jgi:signal recognition particle subunit SRP54